MAQARQQGGAVPKYMIEATHDPSPQSCLRILDGFLYAGAHYLRRADWGCMDGVHKAWIIVEADNDAAAQLMVPPVIRKNATVVKLNKFTPEQIKELHQEYGF